MSEATNNLLFLIILAYLVALFWYLKIEYYPKKARYSENLLNSYIYVKRYLRYEKQTRKYLPDNKLRKY